MILGMNYPHSKDGILYSIGDQVKIACNDCKGCQKCCENMDDTIILDPFDIWQLTHKLKVAGGEQVTFELLVSEDGPLALGYHEGLILPHMKMVATDSLDRGECSFLSNGRCSIHFCRPGMCRLYPLGRVYTTSGDKTELGYIILDDELGCTIKDNSNISVSDWLGISDDRYQDFLIKWHDVKKHVISKLEREKLTPNSKESLDVLMEILHTFYAAPYGNDFFKGFDERQIEFVKNI